MPSDIPSTERRLNICHINISSIKRKLHYVHDLLVTHNLDVLCVTETWLDASIPDSFLAFRGYSLVRRDRPGRRGGGVLMYIRTSISTTHINAIAPATCDLEVASVILEFQRSGLAPWRLPVICVYRPPSSPAVFWEHISHYTDSVTDLTPTNSLCMLGDFNVNVLGDSLPCHYTRFCNTYDVKNVIAEPTRFLSNSCLDLILLSRDLPHTLPCVLPDPISDHYAVKTSLNINLHLDQPRMKITTRRKPFASLDFDSLEA